MSGNNRFSFAIKIVLIYLIIGIIWIVLSDYIANFLSRHLKDLLYIELIKGLFFILTTGVILYFYIVKQTNKFLELEEKYEIIFRDHKSVMLLIDPDTGYIIDANKSAVKFYGYTLEELKKLRIWNINILSEDKVKEEMEKVRLEKRNHFNFKHRLKNGEIKDVEVYSSPAKIGKKTYLYSIIYDVTERIKKEEEIKHLVSQYEKACLNLTNFIENSPLPIIVVDNQGIVVMWNLSAEKVFGWKKEEVIGKFNPIVPSEKKEEYINLIEKIYKGEIITDLEIERINKEGRYLTLKAFISPLYDENGNICNILAIFDDVTEKKRIEAELNHIKKMEAIGKLAAGISHDFNNMLTAIIGFASLLELKTRNNEELNHFAKQILMVSERATILTKGLLTYSREHPFNPRSININDLIKSHTGFLEKIIGENITIKLILDENAKNVYGDPYQIEQVLINILTNAKDAMPEGGVITIETSNYYLDKSFIKIHKYGHVGEYVRISISDTGYGIPKDIQDKIFDPFFTTKEQGKGTGLGLSIVYNIIKQHKGYINVYSEEGIGTTFNIYLPISQEEEVNNFNSEKDSSFVSKLNINILVVDDDEMVLHSLKNYLETLGAQVFTARSGKEALDFFEKNYNNTDLLILDIILPDINGLILYKKIREIKEDIKIIFISGYNISVIKEIEDIDFDVPFIQKPLSMTKLVELINKITSQ